MLEGQGGWLSPHAAAQPSICGHDLLLAEGASSREESAQAPKSQDLRPQDRATAVVRNSCARLSSATCLSPCPRGPGGAAFGTADNVQGWKAKGSLSTGEEGWLPEPPAAHQSLAKGPHIRAVCGCQLDLGSSRKDTSVPPGGQDYQPLGSTTAH